MPVNQQLTYVPLLGSRRPQTRKPVLHQQLQNMSRIAPVRLLPTHIAGANLGRIANPNHMTQPISQLDKPLAVPTCLDTNQRRGFQLAIEPLCLSVPMQQLPPRLLPSQDRKPQLAANSDENHILQS